MKKRLLALALSLVMIVGLLPATVFTVLAEVNNPIEVLVAQNGIAVDGKLNDADWYKFYNLTYTGSEANPPSGTLGMLWDGLKLYVGVTYKNADTFTMTVNGHAVSVALTDPTAPAVTIDGTPVAGVAAGTAGVLEMAIPVTALGCLESTLDQKVSLTGVALTGNTLSANLAGYDGIDLRKYRKNPNNLSSSNQFTHDALAVGPTKPLEKNGVITFAELQGTTYTTKSTQNSSFLRPSLGVTPGASADVYVNMNVNIQELPKLKSTYFAVNQYAMYGALSFAWADGSYLSAWCIFNGGDDETDEVGEGETDYDQTDGYLYMSVPKTVGGSYDNPAIADAIPLGKRVGEEFNLYTHWVEDTAGGTLADLYIYVDGQLVAIVEDAQIEKAASGTWIALNINDGNRSQYNQPAGTTNVPAQVQVSNVLIDHSGQKRVEPHTCISIDDGDCTTDFTCAVCGAKTEDANYTDHTPGSDDGNCATPVACINPACTKNAIDGQTAHTYTDDHDTTCDVPGCTAGNREMIHTWLTTLSKDEGGHWYACSGCDEKKDYAAHSGTADDDCKTETTCVCGHLITAAADAHTYTDNHDTTCNVDGCTAGNREAIHTYEKEVATDAYLKDPADCTNAAVYYKSCACGASSKDTADEATFSSGTSKGHDPAADDGDCTTDRLCTVCGEVAIEGAEKHTGGTATCEKKAECATCGKEYGELAAHIPGEDGDCISGFTCTVCGDNVPASGEHTPADDDGDCTTAIKCTVCGTVTTAAKDAHTPAEDDGDCTTAVKCTVCGTVTTAAKEAHTPAEDDGDCTTAIKCTVCGKETTAAKEAHTEKVVNAKPATETEKGYTGDKVCSVCGKELAKGEEIPVLEPAPTEPAPTTPPATEPSTPDAPVVNPDTGDNGTAVYALLLAVSMLAMVALMIPDIRNKLIRK